MAWVRYDDQFPSHPKVTEVIAEDVGALGLHVLANTWSNAQKRHGFVPAHQPAILLCDRGLGTKWAAVLVHAGLWHERGKECDRCQEYYADLPADLAGFVIHDAQDYKAPARERQTAGTPAELSEKRRHAGSKGGQSTARRRELAQQDEQANPANGASKARANQELLVTPVPDPVPVGASSEAPTTPVASLPPSATKRGTRLPVDFAVSPEMVTWATANVPNVDGRRETEKFTNFWRAKSGRDATKLDWVATWRNWMLNAAERSGSNGHRPYTNPSDPDAYSKGL